jgi:hypothetical protein
MCSSTPTIRAKAADLSLIVPFFRLHVLRWQCSAVSVEPFREEGADQRQRGIRALHLADAADEPVRQAVPDIGPGVDIQAGGPQSITVEDSMSMVHASSGRNKPASAQLLSEVAIVAGIAKATLGGRTVVDWDGLVADYDRIHDAIEEVFPIFQGYNARIRVPGGFHLTSTARERIWATPSGKANFLVFEGCGEDPPQSAPDFLWLSTIRSHDQYNTTLYSMSDRYRGVFGQRDVVFLNEYEMKKRGFADGDRVDLITESSDASSAIPSRTAAARLIIRRPIRWCRSMLAIP